MEKNIKRVGWLVVAAVLSMTFVACSNGIDAIDDSHQQVSYSMNVVASKTDGLESGLRGRALEVYGKMLKDEWKKGDEVKVLAPVTMPGYDPTNPEHDLYDYLISWNTIGTLKAQGNGATTTFSGTLNLAPDKGKPLMLAYPNYPIDFRNQKGTLTDIADNFDYAQSMLFDWAVDDDNIVVPKKIDFCNFNQSIIRFTLKDKDGNALNVTSLTISGTDGAIIQYSNGVSQEGTTMGSITITPDSASSEIWAALLSVMPFDLTLTALGSDGFTYTYTKKDVEFVIHNFYSITVRMNKVVAE